MLFSDLNIQQVDIVADTDEEDLCSDMFMDESLESDILTENSDNDAELLEEDDDSSSLLSESDGSDECNIDFYDIPNLMNKCRIIIKTIRKSTILYETLYKIAGRSSVKVGLVLDMKIRWNSTYTMLHRLLDYQSIFKEFYDNLTSIDGITDKQQSRLLKTKLTEADWGLIQALQRVLHRFYVATTIISGNKYPTLSLAYAIIYSLAHYLNNKSSDEMENALKSMLVGSFHKYMIRGGKEGELLRVVGLLDPITHELVSSEDKQLAEEFILKEVRLHFL